MEELSGTENKVAFVRQYYNDLATQCNTVQQVFPANLVANALEFYPVMLFHNLAKAD